MGTSAWRRWGWRAGAVVAAVGLLIGFRMWLDHQLNAPVHEHFRSYLDALAAQSPNARAYRDNYYFHFSRDSVATRHFEQVCAVMTRMAQAEGANPELLSSPMARSCGKQARLHGGDGLPRD